MFFVCTYSQNRDKTDRSKFILLIPTLKTIITIWLYFKLEEVTLFFNPLTARAFLCLSFFSFSYLFAAVIDLLLGLFPVQKILRKHHLDRQILPWSSHMMLQVILLWVFQSNFWVFSCMFQAPLSLSHWSEYHWKDLFLLQNLSTDDANFGQRWWRQKRNKGQRSSQLVGATVNGLKKTFYNLMNSAVESLQRPPCGKMVYHRGAKLTTGRKIFCGRSEKMADRRSSTELGFFWLAPG